MKTDIIDFKSKRKQDDIHPEKLRVVAIKVSVNEDELAAIEAVREGTKWSRAEIIRAIIAGKKIERAPIVPKINLDLARDLGRALGNLSTLAGAMRGGEFIELDKVKKIVVDLQKTMRGELE